MTPEFYVKAQALHEEFQRRELHYLNIERKMNNHLLWKKDLNLPLQEYLQKINQREKKTDAAYQSIVKQMEDLDRQADAMSFKLEKLGILRSSVSNTLASNWIQKFDSGIVSNPQSNTSHCISPVSNALQSYLKSASTQTENGIYCIKCNGKIFDNNSSIQLSKHVLLSNVLVELNNKVETTQSPNLQLNPQSSSKDICDKFHFVKEDNDINDIAGDLSMENCKTEQTDQNLQKQKQSVSQINADNNGKDFQNELQQNKVSVSVNSQDHQSKNEEKSSLINEKFNETLIVDIENMDSFVSKSDAGSINNEFDFLESDVNKPSKKEEKLGIENVKLSDNHTIEKLNKTPMYEAKFQELKLNSKLGDDKKEKSLKSTPNPNADDNKSETSESMSGYHSPNISITSDSDSMYEKGSPLKASAAYQALLGNTALLKKTPQNVIESESEDELENALATAVQRTSVKNKSVDKQKREETSLEEKPVDRSNKMSSMSKPQSKLSKNTRKVLGLDTSSGSDAEMTVKPISQKKIDEESDEFDFYD